MKSEKLVSAIITTHNRRELFIKALNSVINQTYKNIEILVVDDGSEDGTKEYMQSNELSNVKYLYIPKEKSKGGNYARNIGIKESKGDYIAFLDDDDEWHKEKIKKQVNYLEQNYKIGMVACAREYEYNFKNKKKQKNKDIIEGNLKEKIFTMMPYTTSSIMIKRNILFETGLFDENLKCWQDYELLIRICQKTDIGVIKDYLLLYRVITSDKERITNNFDIFEESVEIIENKHKDLIMNLPKDIKKKHYALIAKDGARRAERINEKKVVKKYLQIAFKNEPNFKNLIKLILNKSKVRG